MSQQEIMEQSAEIVQELLEHSIAKFREHAELLLKRNGDIAEESQLIGILNAVNDVEALINGISPEDIRVPHIDMASEEEQDRFPESELVITAEKIENLAADYVDYGEEDVANQLYRMRDGFESMLDEMDESNRLA